MNGFARWFARRALATQVVLVVVAVVVAANLAIYATQVVAGGKQPGGEAASAHATAADGYAGWVGLLRRSGRPVTLLDQHLDDTHLPAGATVVVAEPASFTREDLGALTGVLRAGGRVVLVGRAAAPILQAGGSTTIGWASSSVAQAAVAAPVPELRAVTEVASGEGVFTHVGSLLPVLVHEGKVVAVVGQVGDGRVVAVASTAVFDNAHLARRGNAAFALGAVGPRGTAVYFDEADHGYGPAAGLSAVPASWKWAGAGLLLAALAAMWARGKRLGPAEELERPLAPPRRLHVDAVAAGLVRARDPLGTGARLFDQVRRDLATSAGVASDDPRFATAARARATAAGVPEHELRALEAPPASAFHVEWLGSVAARLARARHRSPGGSR